MSRAATITSLESRIQGLQSKIVELEGEKMGMGGMGGMGIGGMGGMGMGGRGGEVGTSQLHSEITRLQHELASVINDSKGALTDAEYRYREVVNGYELQLSQHEKLLKVVQKQKSDLQREVGELRGSGGMGVRSMGGSGGYASGYISP